MNKTFVAALALSLVAGTSAFAQERQRSEETGRPERIAEHRQAQTQQQSDRQAQREEARQARNDDNRPARPVPQVSNERAQEAIAAARARQAEHDTVVQARREDHTDNRDSVVAQAAALTGARREAAGRHAQERYAVGAQVTPRPDEHRQTDRDSSNRHDSGDQHVYLRSGHDNDHDADRHRRPGEGHQLRDRDHNRQWYVPDQWRRTYHATHRYRTQHYRTPPGFYIRSWVFGDVLPNSWYAPSYYLNWWSYGLPRPPIGTEWIRSGDDALLVDTWSGEVLSVYYDLFW